MTAKKITILLLLTFALASIHVAAQTQNTNKTTVTESSTYTTDEEKTSEPMEYKPAPARHSLYSLFKKGGPFMWPILLFAAIAAGFIIERGIAFKRMKIPGREAIDDLEKNIEKGTVSSIETFCSSSGNLTSSVLLNGLKHKNSGIERVEKSLSVAGSTTVATMERGLSIISALGNLTPMLGFLGTVSGMISAFADIAAADQVNAKIVASGIEEALLTTAAGLIVAIPTLFAYNFFCHKVDIFVSDTERVSGLLIEKIIEEADENTQK
ncbi:MAG: MotA/TolQ/ExbB proton channel family protein [Spirochaetota bacterium]